MNDQEKMELLKKESPELLIYMEDYKGSFINEKMIEVFIANSMIQSIRHFDWRVDFSVV